MKWKILAGIGFALAVLVLGVWYMDGAMVFTKTAIQTTVKDELFGTEFVVWQEGLWIGLDVAAPAAAFCLAIAGFGFYRSRRDLTGLLEHTQERTC